MAANRSEKIRPPAVIILILLHVLLGIGALGGGGVLVADPTGATMGMPLSMLDGLPFRTFLAPALALALLLGVCPLLVAIGLWNPRALAFFELLNPSKSRRWPFAASISIGVYLMGWTLGEMMIWGWVWPSAIYCAWGGVVVAITFVTSVKRYLQVAASASAR